jgi:uroporphyrinogen decarboxylase
VCGNVDKRALAKGKGAIDQELERCKYLLQFGGFFPSCDHHIPPDVPLENMVYFCNELRKLSHFPETRRVITI